MTGQRDLTPVHRVLPRARWAPPRALLVVAVLVAGVVLVLGAAGIVRRGPAAAPSPVSVLDAGQLRAAIDAQRTGGLAPQDVITDVSIDSSRRTPPLDRECVPLGQCTVLGTLDLFADPAGTVTVLAQDQSVPPPTDPADLRAPIALRLSGSGPIEFLGHVLLAPDGQAFGVPAAVAATASAPTGEVIAVTGWLVGVEGFSCGPVPMPSPPVPAPFSCHVPEFLTEAATEPVSRAGLSGMGSGFQMRAPSGAVQVQMGAYQEYAPSPSFDGVNDVPRLGTYLLRMVAIDQANCAHCRGWLAVGRLDASAAPASPAPSGYQPQVRSTDELALALAQDRPALVGHSVFVDGRVVPGTASGCTEPGPCSLGVLEGTSEPVVATPHAVSQLVPGDDAQVRGVLALVVRQSDLEYLGVGSVPLPLSELADPLITNGLPLQVHPVTAWLVGMGAVPCPSVANVPPVDTPFDMCGGSWLMASAQQPVQRNVAGFSIVVPPGATHVQPGAYDAFAPSPAPEPHCPGFVPRDATYLVRMVSNPPGGWPAQTGWKIVARLAP
ncbi:MAG: hypothetical protein ACP5VP_04355 [Candidatus Limnocylindrales bacterium]